MRKKRSAREGDVMVKSSGETPGETEREQSGVTGGWDVTSS